ncbi:GGDEF domain-containing protein [Desulfotomaculum copahuensis]|uniref:Diguanylate cyclase n=1 Tax=Desulfotomaculum copahuensis TaxID=1838280 RepID=A0A1B7LIV9_9FIRM|nr:GGDEF domain-containing protein [Desulfotomaculum copahuensis]OAT86508.1 hypothetical protein A6M21_03590 [Desulfotomaculum copahuensis]
MITGIGIKVAQLFDKLNLPRWSYAGLSVSSRIPELLQRDQWVGIIYLDIEEFQLTEQIYGGLYCRQVLAALDRLVRTRAAFLPGPYSFLEYRRWGDDLVIYFHSPGRTQPPVAELARLAAQVSERLLVELNRQCARPVPFTLNFHVGYSVIMPEKENPEKAHYNAYKEAVRVAKGELNVLEVERRQRFSALLADRDIRVVYQPVVALDSGRIFGYEALSRGPEDSFFANPLNLLAFAEKNNQLYTLEKIMREKALAGWTGEWRKQVLFLNISPQIIYDPAFHPDEINARLDELGIRPERLVLEITERTGIENFQAFQRSLETYRRHGFKVAVDDAGSGYSSLQAVAELQPEYIKLDLSLIRELDQNPVKRILVETFLTFAEKTGSRVIAEGIENSEELTRLRKIGIPLGQGFFLARPACPPPALSPAAVRHLACPAEVTSQRFRPGGMVPVGSIPSSGAAVHAGTMTRELVDFFTEHPRVEGVAVLDDAGAPVGLVMRDKLFNQLGTQFGFAIYHERPVSLVMDARPLTVEDDSPVEVVSQAAMGRPDLKVYDSIIVTRNRAYLGLVSVRQLLDAITSLQVETARFANPLTGLPGNRQIDAELLNRLGEGRPFSVIYSDLDHFKSFNDRYGFERGDQAIKLTADIMVETVARSGRPGDLVGHIGGDDFIIVTVTEAAEEVCRGVIAEFDRLITSLYDPEDREKGFIDTCDRQGRPVQLPLMTISLALIDCRPGQYAGPEELARVAAGLKKYAKSREGSVFVRERRQHRD